MTVHPHGGGVRRACDGVGYADGDMTHHSERNAGHQPSHHNGRNRLRPYLRSRVCRVAVMLAAVALLPLLAACDAVIGSDGTPAPTRTPAPTNTATPLPPPTATPTPELPPNPDGLQRWTELPVHYCVAAGDRGFASTDEFTSLVEQAFATWGVPATDDGACAAAIDDDRVNEIGWDHLQNADTQDSDVYEAGVTQVRYSECTSGCRPNDSIELVEADVRIDTSPPDRFRSQRCLYSTLLHEVGHFLGLEHLPAPAVMAAETTTCTVNLTDADLEALRARYGERAHPQP